MINFQEELNPQQLAVVENGDGYVLVLAGAGSGKTRTVTYRVAYLLEKGISPDNIMLVTFTNKAAAEMTSRVKDLTGASKNLPWAGTFHSLACRILKKYARVLDYQNNFTILDMNDSLALLKLCSKGIKTQKENVRFPSGRVISSVISFARNAGTTIEDALDFRFPTFFIYKDEIEEIAKNYFTKKKESNAMDFDDLLENFLKLLLNPDIKNKLASQFEYVLVDEYQDTNRIQSQIVKELSSIHKNLLVVGDDAQSIYSFRAADIKNILEFEKEFTTAKIFKLETNYRSGKEILDLANSVISNNIKQYPKNLVSILQTDKKPTLFPMSDQSEEAVFIASAVEKLLEESESKEIAVLFRASHHCQMLEMELVKRNIEYDYRGGLRFFERAHVKDVLSYLRIYSNLADTSAWLRVLMHEEAIGPAGAERVAKAVQNMENIDDLESVGFGVLGGRAGNGWRNFMDVWQTMQEIQKKEVSKIIRSIKTSSYQNYLKSEYVDYDNRLEDIEQLAVFAEKYNDLGEFLNEATLQESYNEKQVAGDVESKIVLSTIHQAKGLEWENVFILNLASGAFPNERALKEDDGLEEERRLFYVAITRAKKNLVFTYPLENGSWGTSSGPSMFLDEIETGLIDDKSFLSSNLTCFNDEDADIEYIAEDEPKIHPGSFLRSIEDL